jgi:predicted  nucleic acid-binding Zn-ribbon protein
MATNSGLLQEQATLTDEARHLHAERQAEVSSIPPEDITIYQNLRQQRRGVAVARVSEKTCSACGSTLSTALLHAAHSPNQLTRCDTCGRILYVG